MNIDERLLQAMVSVIRGAGGTIQVTNLNKALFYADLLTLRNTGETLTGAEYIKMERGPVVDNYKQAIARLAALGWAEQVVHADGDASKPIRLLPGAPPHTDSVAVRMGERAGKRTAAFLSKFSHENPGWIHAAMGGKINMILALQQDELLDEDSWLASPLDRAETEAADRAAAEPEQDW